MKKSFIITLTALAALVMSCQKGNVNDVPASDLAEVTFAIDYTPARTGSFDVALRVYPKNDRLPYRMDFALVKWA